MKRTAAATTTKDPKTEVPTDDAKDTKGREVTKPQQKVLDGMSTWSSKIRYMDAEGFTRTEIRAHLSKSRTKPMLYQHVRNVLVTPLTGPAKK